MANEAIGAAEGRVDACTDANETAWDGEAEVIVFGEQTYDAREDGAADGLTFGVLFDDARPNLDLVAEFEDAGKDGAASYATFEVFDLGAGFVDVERADDNHMGFGLEVADRDRDLGDKSFIDCVDVIFELCGDRDDGTAVSHCALDEFFDRGVVGDSILLSHEIDLVLEDDNVVELHDLNGCEMFGGLRLRAVFVAGNEEKGSVHDCGAREHGGHENIVTGAVHEPRNVSNKECGIMDMTHETCRISLYVPLQPSLSQGGSTSFSLL